MHIQPLFKDSLAFVDGTSQDMFDRGLCLPSPTALSFDELKRVTNVVRDICL